MADLTPGEHIVDGEFQSDKHPTTPRGLVPVSTKSPLSQDLLWTLAQRYGPRDPAFASDLEWVLVKHGFEPPAEVADLTKAMILELARTAVFCTCEVFHAEHGHHRDGCPFPKQFPPVVAAIREAVAAKDAEIERLRAAFQRLIGHCEPCHEPSSDPLEPPELDRYVLDPLAVAEAKGVIDWETPASAG